MKVVRIFVRIAALFAVFFAPLVAFAALVPCGQSAPGSDYTNLNNYLLATSCNLCDFGQLVQNIINYLILLSIPLSAGLFAYAGVLYFTSAANPSQAERAKKIFSSVVVGFIIAISGYLIVQTLLNALLDQNFVSNWSWNHLECASGSQRPRTTTVGQLFSGLFSPTGIAPGSTPYTGGTTSGTRGTQLCSTDNPNCSTTAIQTAANSLGYNISPQEAQAMSCIAFTENSGNPTGCSGTGPCGTFQISQQNWAAYAPATCSASNFGGSITAAQNDGSCNLQTALTMLQRLGYQPWTGNNNGVAWNSAAQQCVTNYDQNTSLRITMNL